jgi:hypothetical protein
MKEILERIETSIPENVKNTFRKKICTSAINVPEVSKHLKNMVESNYEIRNVLFKNNDDAIYFSGDILSKTFCEFWIKGGKIEDIFIEKAQSTSYSAQFECLW